MSSNNTWNEIRQEQGEMCVGCFADGKRATLNEALGDRTVVWFDQLSEDQKIDITKLRVEDVDRKRPGRYSFSVPGLGVISKARALSCLEQYRQRLATDDARLGEMLIRLEERIISNVLAKSREDED